jgi:hypothetical protein
MRSFTEYIYHIIAIIIIIIKMYNLSIFDNISIIINIILMYILVQFVINSIIH